MEEPTVPRRLAPVLSSVLWLFVFAGSSWAQEPASSRFVSTRSLPDNYQIVEGDILESTAVARATLEPRLWAGGVVPYEFSVGSGNLAGYIDYDDGLTFHNENPPRVTSSTEPLASFRPDDLIVVEGTSSNDNSTLAPLLISAVSEFEIVFSLGETFVDEVVATTVRLNLSADVSATNRLRATQAMAEWESVANVDFVPRAGEAEYVLLFSDIGNFSNVGNDPDLVDQEIGLWNWNSHYIIVHELGHTLGYWHEQSRLDRDTYVDINWPNIQVDKESNFDLETSSMAYPIGGFGGYDFDSVMHYSAYSFSICKPGDVEAGTCPDSLTTIDVRPPYDIEWQGKIGQRDHLSYWDAKTMSFAYAPSSWNFWDPDAGIDGQNGSFLKPYQSFASAYLLAPEGGRVIALYPETVNLGFLNRPVIIEAPVGGLLIH